MKTCPSRRKRLVRMVRCTPNVVANKGDIARVLLVASYDANARPTWYQCPVLVYRVFVSPRYVFKVLATIPQHVSVPVVLVESPVCIYPRLKH